MERRTLASRALLILLATVTGLAALPTAAGDPDAAAKDAPYRELLTTGLISLPINHEVRVAVVQGRPDERTLPVEVRLVDARGRVLLHEKTRVGPGNAAVTSLRREHVRTFEPLLVQAQLVIGPEPVDPADPTPLACPLNITIQTTSGDEDDGPVLTCWSSPCECLDGDCGRGANPGVSADCTRGAGTFTSP